VDEKEGKQSLLEKKGFEGRCFAWRKLEKIKLSMEEG